MKNKAVFKYIDVEKKDEKQIDKLKIDTKYNKNK
jgi:hypothetical protein